MIIEKVYITTYRAGYIVWRGELGKYHRKNGPAVEGPNGTEDWYLNGRRHRDDGPAVIDPNGYAYYYLNGQMVNPNDIKNRYIV